MFEIGNSLREARVRQGLEYPQVELATKIRAKYLRAIEDEQFEILPSETYVKGFLRSYAEFLGLDGQLYVDEYTTRYVVDGFDDMPARRVRAQRGDRALERNVVLLALAGIAALTALVIVAWKFGGGGTPATAPPVASQQPAAPTGLEFVGPGTWLQVRARSASGPVLYEGTLRAGEPNFVAGKRFWLSIRHPHRLALTLAGRPVSLPVRARMHVLVTPARATLLG